MPNAFYKLYAETLDLQAQFLSHETRGVLGTLPSFLQAQNILEVGCGAGSQIKVLGSLLNQKNYLGIDVSEDLLTLAKQRFANQSNIDFLQQDVMNFTSQKSYDFILSFAVLQHLPHVENALKTITALLSQNGVLAICDTNENDEFCAHPDLPELRKLYQSLTEDKTKGQRKSHCLQQTKNVSTQLGLEIILEKPGSYKAKTQKEKYLFVNYINHVTRLVAQKYSVNCDLKQLASEFKAWEQNPASWVTMTGLTWLVLKKQASDF